MPVTIDPDEFHSKFLHLCQTDILSHTELSNEALSFFIELQQQQAQNAAALTAE